jgi:hypothetical protein
LKKIYLNYSVLLLSLISCSSSEVRQRINDAPYRTSGIEQFFLPELPAWANYSSVGRCYKSSSFQYLDFPKVHASYQLSYAEMVELQAQYNERREDYFRSTAYRFLKPVEESAFFSNTLEQVRGGVRQFKLPKVSQADIVWLEGFTQGNKIADLRKMAKTGKFDERATVLFSSCLSRQMLNQWVQENGLENVGFYLLSAELLGPYDSKNNFHGGLKLEVSKMINPEVKVNIIVPEKMVFPLELNL